MKYPITEIFHSIQGEGHFVGYPMTFVRFAGCSVTKCSIRKECDEAPWKAKEHLTAEEIVFRVKSLRSSEGGGIVCLTGGEPTDHDIAPIVALLRQEEYRVHIETSGVRSLDGIPFDWITVSPKTTDYVQRSGHTLKVVVRPGWTVSEAREIIERMNRRTNFFHRYLQPMAMRDGTTNVTGVIALLTDPEVRNGWALSTQAHKTWGIK